MAEGIHSVVAAFPPARAQIMADVSEKALVARRSARERKALCDQINIEQMPPQQRGLPSEVQRASDYLLAALLLSPRCLPLSRGPAHQTPLPKPLPKARVAFHVPLPPSLRSCGSQAILLAKWRKLWQYEASNTQRLSPQMLAQRMEFTFRQMQMVCSQIPEVRNAPARAFLPWPSLWSKADRINPLPAPGVA